MQSMMKKNDSFIIGSPVLSLILIFLILFSLVKLVFFQKIELPGKTVEIQFPQKIDSGIKHGEYLTNPPTSGWYVDMPIRDGIYGVSLSDEQLVGALVKGKVVISYNCIYKTNIADGTNQDKTPEETVSVWKRINLQNRICGELISNLRKVVEKKGEKDLIMAPRAKLDTRIALSTWGGLDKFLWFDEKRIIQFIDAYRGQKPKL